METTEATATTETTATPAVDINAVLKQFENADVLTIATKMAEPGISDEMKYKLAKLMLERTKTVFIDPMKEIREKEKLDEQKAAEARSAAVAEFRERINTLIGEEVLNEFSTIAADYIEAGHGQVVTVEIFAKKGDDGQVKAEFSSNIAKARSVKGTSTRARETGRTGAGVTVSGGPKEGVQGPKLASETSYKSFADAARELGFVTDETELKGVNCKRLLESKGYTCGYVEATTAPVAATIGIRK